MSSGTGRSLPIAIRSSGQIPYMKTSASMDMWSAKRSSLSAVSMITGKRGVLAVEPMAEESLESYKSVFNGLKAYSKDSPNIMILTSNTQPAMWEEYFTG